MTPEITLTLAILAVAAALFVTERLRVDAVALLVLISLALTGLVTPAEALSGFSNPAVVTVWAMFVLSGGLSRTGVANRIGRQVLHLAGHPLLPPPVRGGEGGLVVVIMLTAGVLSAFMNNVAVTAMLLPVVVDIAWRTGRPPSKLLIPLAFGSLLGGLSTLIGTPPNLLVSVALHDHGLRPFQLFDYTPVGLVVMLAGVAYMVLVGRHLLPRRELARESLLPDWRQFYDLGERLFVVRVPPDAALAGQSLAQSRLGAALGLNVVSIIRNRQTLLSPGNDEVIRADDRLLVEGRSDRLTELVGRQNLIVETEEVGIEDLISAEIDLVEVGLSPRSELLGQTLRQIDFRRRFGVNVLALWRDGVLQRTNLQDTPLRSDDTLLCQGHRAQIDSMRADPDFIVSDVEVSEVYRLHERLFAVRVPEDSAVVGKTLAESRLGDAFGLTVLAIHRGGTVHLVPGPEDRLEAGDTLLVEGKIEDLRTLHGLQDLEIERQPPPELRDLESERVGLVEAVLSPHTTLVGKTLRQLDFREKYGLSVLAIWRQGRAYRSDLRDMALRFGDALLLYGPREKFKVLGREPDFLLLAREVQEAPRLNKAPLAVLVMVAVLLTIALGWLPISIAAVTGATLMVLTGCLNMEEAHRFIEWKVVFLIAGMLPLSIAMEQSGAAHLLAESIVAVVGRLGPTAVLAGLFVVTSLAAQVIPTHAVAVLMAPIAFNTASNLGISPYASAMVVALSTSASFLSPVGHPANVLIMGPGGYRFTDYTKVGVPLTLMVLLVVLLVVPFFWPLFP
ncbi:MAG: SLC13 family permease [Chloroflexi bacterium]|nr:SLC13 family permease [Chloroflexota bacterium]